MISDTAISNLHGYYNALHGQTEAIVQAFNDARAKGLIADDIEWVEPFGTLHGADAVIRDLFRAHTTAMSDLFFRADAIFPANETCACVIGHTGGALRTGAELSGQFVHVWEFKDSTAIRMTTFNEDGVLQRALGLDPRADEAQAMAALRAALQHASDSEGS